MNIKAVRLISLTALAGAYAFAAHAGSLSGPGSAGVVRPGDAAESWTLSDGADLTLQDGAQAGGILATGGSTLTAAGARIAHVAGAEGGLRGQSALYLEGSRATLSNTVVESSGGNGLVSAGVNVYTGAQLSMSGGGITATGRALNVFAGAAEVSGAALTARSDGRRASPLNGSAAAVGRGSLTLSGSSLTGDTHALVIYNDTGSAGNRSDVTVSGGSLTSLNDSLIRVYNVFPGSAAVPAPEAYITLNGVTDARAGNGVLLDVQNGAATVAVNGSALSGDVRVAGGSAALALTGSRLAGTLSADAASALTVALRDGSQLTGAVQNASSLSADATSAWVVTGDSQVGALTNAGAVRFSEGATGRTLTVTGDYAGDNGLLVFNSVLGGDDSVTDHLAVGGDTTGTTRVAVTNLGGSGAKTLNGIELITVGGRSDGAFTQQGRIVAGAYDYRLLKRGGNWYLSNEETDPVDPPVDPVDPTEPPVVAPVTVILRPEAGAYAGNQAAARTMFDAALSARPAEGSGPKRDGVWLKGAARRAHADDSSGQLATRTTNTATVLGADLWQAADARGGLWRAGAFAGAGSARGHTRSSLTGYRADGRVTGYALGAYGTWYASGEPGRGLYADAVVQHGWYRNRVQGEDEAAEQYNTRAWQGSLEAGYGWRPSALPALTLTPSARVTLRGDDGYKHRESNGTAVTATGKGSAESRVGLKAAYAFAAGAATVSPYAEAAWRHSARGSTVSLDGVSVTSGTPRNAGELTVGVEVSALKGLTVSAGAGREAGDGGWRAATGRLDVRWLF